MNISQRVVGDVTIVELHGKFDQNEDADALQTQVRQLITGGVKKVVVDLAKCPYVNSTGLGSLVRSWTDLNRNGGQLKLLRTPKSLQNLLSVTKLLTIFETYDEEQPLLASWTTVSANP